MGLTLQDPPHVSKKHTESSVSASDGSTADCFNPKGVLNSNLVPNDQLWHAQCEANVNEQPIQAIAGATATVTQDEHLSMPVNEFQSNTVASKSQCLGMPVTLG